VLDAEPLEPAITKEMLAERFRNGQLEVEERHILRENLYFNGELRSMLHSVGFENVRTEAGHTGLPPKPDEAVVVFIAERKR
jgi:hypothetical protein